MTNSYDCYWNWTGSQGRRFYKSSELSDLNYYHHYGNWEIDPPRSYDSYFECHCPMEASLQWYDNNYGWRDISSSPSSTFSWISSFTTGSWGDGVGRMYINSPTQGSTETVRFKISIWEQTANWESGTQTWDFDVTVHPYCSDNYLTDMSAPSDISYTVYADGSTAS